MGEILIKVKTNEGEVEAYKCAVLGSNDSSGEVRLSDGTTISFRQAVIDVARLKDKWDSNGYPQYLISFQGGITVMNVDPKLKKSEK